MALNLPRTGLTWDDYLALPDDGNRYEIIEGELYMSPAPSEKHQRVSFNLSTIFGIYNRVRRAGRFYSAPFDVRLAFASIVQPDILFISRERLSLLTAANLQGAPDLVVEIISPSSTRTDQETKRDLYARYGVKYFWIVEPLAEWIRAYELGADGLYELVAEAHGRETFAAPPFADLPISLAELWDE